MMQKAIFKMKIFYVTYAIICVWFVIILTMFSFEYERLFATLWWSKLVAFGTNMGVISIVLVGMTSLTWGEADNIESLKEVIDISANHKRFISNEDITAFV
ncbi:hypothetical protein DFS34DRAFT_649711 [Phlyctochytrium arcticum]|nr:hypothetical protein DFS34DRAFT_649711 [Phlyctochytrium arcticum]